MRYLIVGYGNIGHKRELILGKNCVATFDPDPKAKAVYTNLEDIPMDTFDAAVLTVPQKPKYELTKFFLSKKKHVLIEKPLILSIYESKILLKIAKKNNVIWHTSYNHRFEPNIVKIQKLLGGNTIGKLYHARFEYSFGNIKERIGTWRETKFGVLEEIVPHIFDFIFNFWKYKGQDFKSLIARKVESNIFDHFILGTIDNKISIQLSAVVWKNIFSIDIYGELGSIHMNGLNKWGGSKLIVRKRVFPSGVPHEKIFETYPPDKTWSHDFIYFEKMVKDKKTSILSDLEMSAALSKIYSTV